jgi:ArsR family transcriptional regulator
MKVERQNHGIEQFGLTIVAAAGDRKSNCGRSPFDVDDRRKIEVRPILASTKIRGFADLSSNCNERAHRCRRFWIYGYMDKRLALAALAALGQDTRLEVFRLLVHAGDEGIPAGEIASRLGTVQNTMSAHLKVLDHAGLVRAERDGRVVRYVADMTGFRDLLAYLMEDCCNGAPDLCQPVIQAITCNC